MSNNTVCILQGDIGTKIVTIMGSPKKNGKTAFTLNAFEQKMSNAGHVVQRFNVASMKVNGCIGCMACYRSVGKPGCAQKDDGVLVIEQMLQADAIVYASPVYAYDFTAQFKTIWDRHFCLLKTDNAGKPLSLMKNKITSLLLTCGGPEEGNTDLIKVAFNRAIKDMLQTRLVGQFVVAHSMSLDFESLAFAVARQMAQNITSEACKISDTI
ncbi:MAG: flavodoxin family protein [Deltaproteobacteria bacterium]|nr:flavodoxin family protein [Deltaproteobacteria bacterium]